MSLKKIISGRCEGKYKFRRKGNGIPFEEMLLKKNVEKVKLWYWNTEPTHLKLRSNYVKKLNCFGNLFSKKLDFNSTVLVENMRLILSRWKRRKCKFWLWILQEEMIMNIKWVGKIMNKYVEESTTVTPGSKVIKV